jgi:sulfite exporter TauE/SafE
MALPALLPPFVVGLLGSVHCLGMCGGIVAAFSQVPPRRFPVPVVTLVPSASGHSSASATAQAAPSFGAGTSAPVLALDLATRTLAYNTGRIASYATAGALAGGTLGRFGAMTNLAGLQQGAYVLANLMLVLLGLYLAGWFGAAAHVERLGAPIWRRIEPCARRLGPASSLPRLLALGALWGWLPCAMVYSMLLTAMLGGSAVGGAATMAAFGLGTLPMLLAAGMMGASLRGLLRRRAVRIAGGLLVLGFGVLGLARVVLGHVPGPLAALCLGGGA